MQYKRYVLGKFNVIVDVLDVPIPRNFQNAQETTEKTL